jgi:uncharacterized protein YciI
MQFAYVYFMKPEPDRVGAVAQRHARYRQRLAVGGCRGGPFVDRSGGLILFESTSPDQAEHLVAEDPFLQEQLLEPYWLKEWGTDTDPRNEDVARAAPDHTGARV